MQTLFISAFQPFVSRNILNTGVLQEFLKRDARVVIFVSPEKYDYYLGVYGNLKNVVIESFKNHRSKLITERLAQGVSEIMTDTVNKTLHRKTEYARTKNIVRYYLTTVFTKTFGNSNLFKKLFRFLDSRINASDVFSGYFEKYKPRAVFAPNVFGKEDVLLMRSSKKANVKTVGMVLSWDNNTSKGLMRVVPDMLIVQNEVIKKEAIEIEVIPEKIIAVSGIPHYDYYKTYIPLSRTELCQREGLDPDKKIIFVSPAGRSFIDTDWHIFEILKKAVNSHEIKEPVQFILSVHPTNFVDFGEFEPDKNFIIRRWGVDLKDVRTKSREFDMREIDELIDIIANTDVVINVISSMVIDAAVLDKPIVTIGFDGWAKDVPYTRSVKRYLELENMEGLLETEAAPIVENKKQLISWVNKYLEDPDIDKDKRQQLVKRQCGILDNKAKKRIVNTVMNSL